MFGALVATGGQARALEGRTEPVAPAAKITLGMLSVKPLGVDRPWDPRICIGCEPVHGPAQVWRPRHRRR
ncbi:hypothetical protein [Methylobacterium sp. J-067]|uniref:hypothetical protein n=1 Tax=Methylobacterium sp. J-067 TaxID=2836648 RepID=UPI001FBA2665|nr:hypothetical protein [Methylobacterium sp. J-067]